MKKFLIILGIVLFVGVGAYGIYTLHQRHTTNELVQANKSDGDTTPSKSDTSDQTPAPPAFDKTTHSTTDATSIWVIVNKKHPLNPLQYTPTDLTLLPHTQYMRAEAAAAVTKLVDEAGKQGLVLHTLSGYRSYATQVTVYNNEVSSYGQATADTESARPGYSEHQSGWSVDMGGGGCGIEDCFGNTAEGKWLAANAYQYGFIIRYPADKVAVTGYRYEPWHIRYIGADLSKEMHDKGVETLEEFFNVSGGDYTK
jgi:D-alanyl-D-alanine carboxypeptidase